MLPVGRVTWLGDPGGAGETRGRVALDHRDEYNYDAARAFGELVDREADG